MAITDLTRKSDPGRPRHRWNQVSTGGLMVLVACLAVLVWLYREHLSKDPEISWRADRLKSTDPVERSMVIDELLTIVQTPEQAATARPIAEQALRDPDPRVRIQAGRMIQTLLAIEETRRPTSSAALRSATRRALTPLFHDSDANVRAMALVGLGQLTPIPTQATGPFREALTDPDPLVRAEGYTALIGSELELAERNALARQGLADRSSVVRYRVLLAVNNSLLRRDDRWNPKKITSDLEDETLLAVIQCIPRASLIDRVTTVVSKYTLEGAMSSKNDAAAVNSLGRDRPGGFSLPATVAAIIHELPSIPDVAVGPLLALLDRSDPALLRAVLGAFQRTNVPVTVPRTTLLRLLKQEDREVAEQVTSRLLRYKGDPSLVADLLAAHDRHYGQEDHMWTSTFLEAAVQIAPESPRVRSVIDRWIRMAREGPDLSAIPYFNSNEAASYWARVRSDAIKRLTSLVRTDPSVESALRELAQQEGDPMAQWAIESIDAARRGKPWGQGIDSPSGDPEPARLPVPAVSP